MRTGQYYGGQECEIYYICVLGRKTMQRCGPGLHWNRERNLCDWPSEAKCGGEGQKIIEETGKTQLKEYNQ